MVHDSLVNVLGLSLRHARWALHLLTEEFKAQWVIPSIKMSRILQNQKPMNFTGVLTGDESWFFLEYSGNCVWRLGNEKAPEMVS
jgi:hypothetical protein